MNRSTRFFSTLLLFGLLTSLFAYTAKGQTSASVKQEMLNDPLTKEYVVSFRKMAAAMADPDLRAKKKEAKTKDEVNVFYSTIKMANGKTQKESSDELSAIYMKLAKKYMKDKNMAHEDFKEAMKLGLHEEQKNGKSKEYMEELKAKLRAQTTNISSH